MAETRTPGFCALCKSRCGSILVTRDGRFVGQEPNPDHPTGKALCIKGRSAAEIVYSPQRQLYPLMRTNPKGAADPGWKRISWDEALDRTAEALARIRTASGPEAVAFGLATPSGTPISDDVRWIERLANAFGTPNVAYGVEICNWLKDFSHAYTFGRSIASPDFENTGCVVLWGHNPSATWLDHATATASSRARGARLIVVDPRNAGFASRADQWLRVRPGADGALALGIAREMIRNGWFDEDFVREWTNGPLLVRSDTNRFLRARDLAAAPEGSHDDDLIAWDDRSGSPVAYSPTRRAYGRSCRPALFNASEFMLRDGTPVACRTAFQLYRDLCDQYPPERVEAIAWVARQQVAETARLLYEARPVCYYSWSGISQHTNGTQADRAIAILMALTGSFDVAGGNVEFGKPPANPVTGSELLDPQQRAKSIGLKRSALGPGRFGWIGSHEMYDSILDGDPYAIRGLVGFGRNFIVNHANSDRGAEALSKLDFFVHADVVVTPTAGFADIFLPVNTPWERESLRTGFEGSQAAENLIQLRPAAIAPLGESRQDAFIVFELARRLGLGHHFWNGDLEAALEYQLAPLNLGLADLRANPQGVMHDATTRYRRYVTEGFKTPTGKVEIFSEAFRDAGEAPLPEFVEPAASPNRAAGARFPLVLTSAKIVHYCHGQHRHVPSLRRRAQFPEISLHPDTAAVRGISGGDWVEIQSPHGRVRMLATLDAGLDPKVVSAQYGWWQGNDALGLPGYDPFSETGANYNRLIPDDAVDPVSGATGLRSSLCEVRLVAAAGGEAWPGWRDFRIAARREEAADVVSLVLQPDDGAALPAFRGGQYLTVQVAGPRGPLVRCYSLSSIPREDGYRITVKRIRKGEGQFGQVSDVLFNAEIGMQVRLRAPRGDFCLSGETPDAATRIVLVAAGIGITPLLGMLYELRDAAWPALVHLFYGVGTGRDHAFRAEIDALRTQVPGLQVTTFYSRPRREDQSHSAFDLKGRIEASHLLALDGASTCFYLCGPAQMIAELTEALGKAGVPKSRLRVEAFGPSSLPGPLAGRAPQPVRLLRSGTTLDWSPQSGTLLDLLEKAGVPAASGCRTGQCESCSLQLIDGVVEHPAGTAQFEEGHCLPCVGVPTTPITLDI